MECATVVVISISLRTGVPVSVVVERLRTVVNDLAKGIVDRDNLLHGNTYWCVIALRQIVEIADSGLPELTVAGIEHPRSRAISACSIVAQRVCRTAPPVATVIAKVGPARSSVPLSRPSAGVGDAITVVVVYGRLIVWYRRQLVMHVCRIDEGGVSPRSSNVSTWIHSARSSHSYASGTRYSGSSSPGESLRCARRVTDAAGSDCVNAARIRRGTTSRHGLRRLRSA